MQKLYIVLTNETAAPSPLLSSHGLWLFNERAAAVLPAQLVPELPDGGFSELSSAFEPELFLLGTLTGKC